LVCDLLGFLPLRRIGEDGTRLVTGIEKLIRFNRERFGALPTKVVIRRSHAAGPLRRRLKPGSSRNIVPL
jgi:hypothetical protein